MRRVIKFNVPPSMSPRLANVPKGITRPQYAKTGHAPPMQNRKLLLKSPTDMQNMRPACLLAKETLQFAQKSLVAGMSTAELDRLCHEFIIGNDGYPSPLRYDNFPKSICTSVNNVVCHGVPCEDLILQNGDLISVDVTCYLNGFHGDTCATFVVHSGSDVLNSNGDDEEMVKMINVCRQAVAKSVERAKNLGDIARCITAIATENNFTVVPGICGHGIGRDFHELPFVYHSVDDLDDLDEVDSEIELRPGMVFTVEPVFTNGDGVVDIWPDGWTVVTDDDSMAVQFEHTIAITANGPEILT